LLVRVPAQGPFHSFIKPFLSAVDKGQ
jgi:hypothetical protein